MVTELNWIFEPEPAYGGRRGGLATSEVFQSRIETLIRESLQNCRDQRLKDNGDGCATVRFTLREISGDNLHDFLERVQWETLRQHVDGSALPEYTEIGPKLRKGLERLNNDDSLRLLLIEDSDTHGLNGEEIGRGKGNFDNLVRSEMINDPDRTDSGGSYGLGKSVYWTFSEISTVIFASVGSDELEPLIIGRCDLASHSARNGNWSGPGFFGILDANAQENEQKTRAVSLRGAEAMAQATSLGFRRREDETGTSIMILGFDDPSEEDEPGIVETCERLVEETVRWYWPALLGGTLNVEVVGEIDGEVVFRERPPVLASEMPEDVRHFVEAFERRTEAREAAPSEAEAGETVRTAIDLRVPARLDGSTPEMTTTATLLARRSATAEPDDEQAGDRRGRAALLRGSGMVVEYRQSKGDFDGHAVLLVGKAKDEFSEKDEAADQFVRACEPPAHDTWDSSTNRAKKDYASGQGNRVTARSALVHLFGQLTDALTVEDKTPADGGTEGPQELRERFRLGGRDKTDEPPKRFLLRVLKSTATSRYDISASFQRTSTNPPGKAPGLEIQGEPDRRRGGERLEQPDRCRGFSSPHVRLLMDARFQKTSSSSRPLEPRRASSSAFARLRTRSPGPNRARYGHRSRPRRRRLR